jgi:cephalosporin hydroxylase
MVPWPPMSDVDAFHRLFYNSNVWSNTSWLGHRALKCPLDLWIYQELIADLKPALIIETGTYAGGSAMFMASICDMVGAGEIVSIDIGAAARPEHPRVRYITGSSIDLGIVGELAVQAAQAKDAGRNVMVILDSDHSRDHVRMEMTLYAPMVTMGSYLIVEDTNVNGRPVAVGFGAGPGEAVDEFMSVRSDFIRDAAQEKFMMTFNPGGYLKRVA